MVFNDFRSPCHSKPITAVQPTLPLPCTPSPQVVDEHVQQRSIQYIDILSIDAEGNDALVLEGAAAVLPKRVGYVEFEYHVMGAWANTTLRHVIRQLQWQGFVCYWLGIDALWRITGCWHRCSVYHAGRCFIVLTVVLLRCALKTACTDRPGCCLIAVGYHPSGVG